MSESFEAALLASSAPENAVVLRALRKVYRGEKGCPDKEALKGVDLKIPRGCIFGLLGPNGAGKSTLINILAGLVNKTSGVARVWGCDVEDEPRRARCAIGVVPQELNLDSFFTPRELLEQQAGLYGVPGSERRTDDILAAMDLTDYADLSSRVLSGGMRRRLMIGKALVHNPPVLVLDEPTAGVDVELRHSLWNYIRELNDDGVTIVLTTHYLEEAEELCDRIAIIHQGEIVANDTKENLLKRVDNKEVTLTLGRPVEELPATLSALGWEKVDDRTLTIKYKPSQTRIGQALLTVQALGYVITDVSAKNPDLETLFLALTKGEKEVNVDLVS